MLTGKLVRLRPLEITDLERNVAWVNDPEVTEFLELRYFISSTAEESWLRSQASQPVAYDHVTLAIETLPEGRHIGNLGFHEVKAEDRKATFGIMIGDKDCWNRGYGTDATLTLLRFAFEEMNVRRVMLHVDERNARAIACLPEVRLRRGGPDARRPLPQRAVLGHGRHGGPAGGVRGTGS